MSVPASRRPLPSYLAVVPPPGKRFKRPKAPSQPFPITAEELAPLKTQADYADRVIASLVTAARGDDPITTFALARPASIEVTALACMARNLAERVVPSA